MDVDITDVLFELINENDAEYTEPADIVTLDELVTIESTSTDETDETTTTKKKNSKRLHYEYDIKHYELPPDVTEEEMEQLIKYEHNTRRIHTDLTKFKISMAHCGVKHNDETKKKISESLKNRTLTPEHRQKIKDSMSGKTRKPMSKKTKKKISDSLKKRNINETENR